jgi:hypothetical protein
VTADLRFTTDDIAKLTPEQTEALFEGIGKLAAATVATPQQEVSS